MSAKASTHATHHPSVCPLDCPDRCSLDVEVVDGRVTRIGPTSINPLTSGFICNKVARFGERLSGPDRLLHPMRRSGPKGAGEFARISWDEAIATITDRFEEISSRLGAEAILPFFYGGSNGLLTQGILDERYFRFLGASRLARTVCAAPSGAAAKALYGKMAGVDFAVYESAKLIVVWGANPSASNIHLVPILKQARKRGAKVALVDPRRTLPAGQLDRHLAIHPGTDLVVALAMIGHLETIGAVDRAFLEEWSHGADRLLERARAMPLDRAAAISRVPAREIASLAELYAESDPAVVRCGWGLERNRNGENAVAAVLALPAVAGKFGKPGGGYTMSASGAYQVDDAKLVGFPETATRTINMNHLGRVLTEPPSPRVAALFVYNCNPVVTVPDQRRIEKGLLRDDLFTVVFEQVMTDTARYADILLPATTFLEHRELTKSYGGYLLQLSLPAIEPMGEALPNEEVFRRLGLALAERRGRGAELFNESAEDILSRAIGSIGAPLAARTFGDRRAIPFDFPGPRPIPFVNSFPLTADRKIDLFPASFGEGAYRYLELPDDPRHPFAMISPSAGGTISSTLAETNLPEAFAEIHPGDAAARSIAEGDVIRLHNGMGEILCRARLSDGISPGVIALPKGLWKKASRNGAVASALVPDAVTAISGGACFNDARVDVERVGPAA